MPLSPFTEWVKNPDETIKIARRVASQLRRRDILLLDGNLGAGKSFFARAVIRHLIGRDIDVPSPTFSLVQIYDLPNGESLWHFDLYRIKHKDEIWELGMEDAMNHAITLVEWPHHMGDYIPPHAMCLRITTASEEASPVYTEAEARLLSLQPITSVEVQTK